MDVLESDQLNTEQAFRHWYYRSKFRLLLHNLEAVRALNEENRIADFGCGLGTFLTFLERRGIFPPDHMEGIDNAFAGPRKAINGSVTILPDWPKDRLFDVIIMMDVLEHIEDDAAALQEAVRHLRGGGYVFITVPAFHWLFSAHDRFLGHFRRYTKNSLGQLIAKCPRLEAVNIYYYYATVLPLAAPLRLLRRSKKGETASDLKHLPPLLNLFLRLITHLELPFADWNHLFGLSVVALCRKSEEKPAR